MSCPIWSVRFKLMRMYSKQNPPIPLQQQPPTTKQPPTVLAAFSTGGGTHHPQKWLKLRNLLRIQIVLAISGMGHLPWSRDNIWFGVLIMAAQIRLIITAETHKTAQDR